MSPLPRSPSLLGPIVRCTPRGWFLGWFFAATALAWIGCAPDPKPPILPQAEIDLLDPALRKLVQESHRQVLARPDSADTWGRLGQAFDVVDLHPQAAACYEQAMKLDPKAPRWPHLLGLIELQDAPDAAIQHLARAAELTPQRADPSRLRLAQALLERGRLDEAGRQLDQLLKLQPDHPAGCLARARLHLARNELLPASRSLQPSLTNSYTARPALLLLATIQQRQGLTEPAAELAQLAAARPRPFDWPDPYLAEVERLRVDRTKLQDHINGLLQSRQHAEADAAIDRLLRAYPNDPEGLLLRGRLRIQERKCEEAEAVLRQHLQIQPHSLNGLTQLATSLVCQQRWNDAATTWRQTVTLKPDFGQGHYNLGLCLARQGDSAGAIESFQASLRCTPGDVAAHAALGEEFARLGQRSNAQAHLESAERLNPSDPRVLRLRARLAREP